MNIIYKLEKISKQYKDKDYIINVLDECDLEIYSGDMIAITGKSGSGKSTLLHIMGLLDEPSSGNIYFCDKKISSASLEDRHICEICPAYILHLEMQ